ncbi:hypothetical protein SLS58_006940 [Diplodia intermedia]|uniref:Rhodopsin domain-containing protein n=1 Tax=Diplodia intermedia TaxID=856260 RepID=A0ABR3TLN6_9PEZI
MARFLSKLSSRVTTIRYWLRAHHEDGNGWFSDHSTRDMDFFDIGISDKVPYGLGEHLASIPPEYRAINAAMTWAVLFPYYVGLCLVKASALLQMLRVFAIPRVRTACLTLLSFVALFCIWRTVTALIACHLPPAPLSVHDGSRYGRCVAPFPLLYINCAINIALDVLITLLPLRVIANLRLAARRKRILTAVFALGLIPTIPSSIRLHALATSFTPTTTTQPHQFITATPSSIRWTALDLSTAIICACGPALGPLYTLLASHLPRPALLTKAGGGEDDDACNTLMMVLSPPPPASSTAAMMFPLPLVAGSVTMVAAAGVAVPTLWQKQQQKQQRDDNSNKSAVELAPVVDSKRVENVGVAVTTDVAAYYDDDDDDDDDDALSDLVEFAGFTGLTGDAGLDGFLVAARLEKARSREELLAVARRPSAGTTATAATTTTTTVRVREVVGGYDVDDDDDDDDDYDDGIGMSRVSVGVVSEGRASSTIELV